MEETALFGYIYETTDLRNGKTYIGQHKRSKFDSSYYGSGKIITDIIKKHGKQCLQVKLIDTADTWEELDELEKKYIAEARNLGKAEYNLAGGGSLTKGCVWINNRSLEGENGCELAVDPSNVPYYLERGWVFGRFKDAHNIGKIGVHKDGVNKYIQEDELDSYLSQGWEQKFVIDYKETSTEGLIWIHKGEERKMILPEERSNYPDWEDGHGRMTNNNVSEKFIKGHVFIHKGTERKVILPEERELYPEWEDGLGPVGSREEEYMWIHKGSERHFIPVKDRDKYSDFQDGNGLDGMYMWIHKGSEIKYILKSDRSNYLDWLDGKGENSSLKGKFMWIHNDNQCKYIPVADRDSYPDWKDGQGKGTRKVSMPKGQYIWIHKGDKQTRIRKEDRCNYPDWEDGKLRGTHIWIHNGKESKFINKADREKYPNWHDGHL